MYLKKSRKAKARLPAIIVASEPGSGGSVLAVETAKRRAFIRQSFNAKITDPRNYDLTINTSDLKIESAVEAVIGAVMAGLGTNTQMTVQEAFPAIQFHHHTQHSLTEFENLKKV